MSHHMLTSDIHFAKTGFVMMPQRDPGVAYLIGEMISALGVTHTIFQPVNRTYKDLPEAVLNGPATIHRVHHLGDFIS